MLASLLSSHPVLIGVTLASCLFGSSVYVLSFSRKRNAAETPVSVNYHFSRKCNYECGFCFHTETTSNILSLDDAKRGMKLLKEAGMEKLNFAGGEPFLYPNFLHGLLEYGKLDLKLESISIVSNGSKINEKFLRDNAKYLDILAISCDSFNAETNIKIGRGKTGKNVEQLLQISEWCQMYGIKFKINTVVCHLNWDEDMSPLIAQAQPFRWKVFQCLIVTGENDNEKRKRDARKFLVTDEQWQTFCDKHKNLDCFVPESNALMKDSYLILDEDMCFLDKGDGQEVKSESILKVGVKKAMTQVKWNQNAFVERGGFYDWAKPSEGGCGDGDEAKKLDW